MKWYLTAHARKRVSDRILHKYRRLFVQAVIKAITKNSTIISSCACWAVKVKHNKDIVGYACGKGNTWHTTLDGGKAPRGMIVDAYM